MLLKLNNIRNGKLELKMGLRVVELALPATHLGQARTSGLLVGMNLWKGNIVKLAYVAHAFFVTSWALSVLTEKSPPTRPVQASTRPSKFVQVRQQAASDPETAVCLSLEQSTSHHASAKPSVKMKIVHTLWACWESWSRQGSVWLRASTTTVYLSLGYFNIITLAPDCWNTWGSHTTCHYWVLELSSWPNSAGSFWARSLPNYGDQSEIKDDYILVCTWEYPTCQMLHLYKVVSYHQLCI